MIKGNKKMYTWMHYPDAEIWKHDKFKTIQECIDDAKENYFIESGEEIYIGECQDVYIGGIYLDDVLDRVEEYVYEEVGEVSEGWDIMSRTGSYDDRYEIYEKYDRKLRELIMDYIKEIKEVPTFYKIINIQELTID